MALQVIVGSGPVGSAVARTLLDRGEQVRVVTRSGTGVDGTERIAADAADADRLIELTDGAAAIYNCVNPPYHQWASVWPPISEALIRAAEASGAVLAVTGNLYGYGEVDGPMTESTPLRATGVKGRVRNRMSADATAAHQAGRIRTFEVRGSDYLGGNSLLSSLVTPAWKKGRTAWIPADLDAPHSWTDVRTVGELLATGATDERAWGRVWHVPTAAPRTLRELSAIAAEQLGVKNKLRSMPYPALWAAGLFDKTIKEFRETQHQFRKPYVLDSSAAQQTFGIEPRPIADSVAFDLASEVSALETSRRAAREHA